MLVTFRWKWLTTTGAALFDVCASPGDASRNKAVAKGRLARKRRPEKQFRLQFLNCEL
jgi:hypothetical protein